MIARRHMHEFGTTREHLAAVAVKNHENGALNPDAQMRKVITLEQAHERRPIADPLNLYDCSLISDGAAAVVLCAAERAREFTDKPVQVLGVAQASDYVALDHKSDITTFPAVRGGGAKGLQNGGSAAARISNSPNCTIASPSPRSSPWRIWASSSAGAADSSASKAARGAVARCRSTPAAG